jgi:hypothetical protein
VLQEHLLLSQQQHLLLGRSISMSDRFSLPFLLKLCMEAENISVQAVRLPNSRNVHMHSSYKITYLIEGLRRVDPET